MNAGAEYVLYRIWATLQDREGIHAESLLACVGALAGYACRAAAHAAPDALNRSLLDSPMSVWALVRRSVQKLGMPLPEIGAITSAVSRASEAHPPRVPAAVYLKQLWPQVLPIARRFCRKPGQLPVLFGIALQRAIEYTAAQLNPTLGASIAMECAIAMSRVELLGGVAEDSGGTHVPLAVAARGRARAKAAVTASASVGFSVPLPSMKIMAAIASVAIIAIGVRGMLSSDRSDAGEPTRVVRTLKTSAFQASMLRPSPFQAAAIPQDVSGKQRPAASPGEQPLTASPPPPPDADEPPPFTEQDSQMPFVPESSPNEGIISEDGLTA